MLYGAGAGKDEGETLPNVAAAFQEASLLLLQLLQAEGAAAGQGRVAPSRSSAKIHRRRRWPGVAAGGEKGERAQCLGKGRGRLLLLIVGRKQLQGRTYHAAAANSGA